ncbi:amidohydrolase family protein [Actinocorallia sp. API 0066]|uniref:amidohydrolase n=1 Tax=Actinocorallia sp. API 0066 TaxID=2896846 RepID=UPI001E577852|nr:amidohydrolase [Actinocorallia sp. API 0066]MCD0450014.1 amidohydrolase family protein [Actinocorallia sp. API 0066]
MDLLLRGALLPGRTALTDLLLSDGLVAAEGADLPSGAPELDVGGRLVLPAFVDAHCHLDKTLWGGPWVPNTAGPHLQDKIDYTRRRRAEFAVPSADRIEALLRHVASLGTAHVRTHTDISPEFGLDGFHAVRAAADRVADLVTVEQVAFPQYGMLTNPGTAELMAEALRTGAAQVVGGIDPAGLERDPVRHLDVVFGLAAEHGVPVDLHLHDRGSLGAYEYELIIERTLSTGMSGRVTIGHGYALGDVSGPRQAELVSGLAEAGISVVTCAAHSDPVLPILAMAEAGANLAAGNDGIRDLWSPYGDGDMLARAHRIAERAELYADPEIELALTAATHGGARALGLPAHGTAVGVAADLVIVEARTVAEAVMSRPSSRLVLRAGVVVSR